MVPGQYRANETGTAPRPRPGRYWFQGLTRPLNPEEFDGHVDNYPV